MFSSLELLFVVIVAAQIGRLRILPVNSVRLLDLEITANVRE
jgi:hypothetical protein